MDSCLPRRPSKNPNGRDKELTDEQRVVVRQLRAKGQSYESLAVGFGVSYNTIRGICAEEDPANEEGQ